MERLNADSAVGRAAGFFKLKSKQQLCGQTILHSDDSPVVLNVKDDVKTGQITASVSDRRYPASDLIDNALLRWFELLLGTCWSLLWPTL